MDILSTLADYARNRGLSGDFELRPIRFIIELTTDGKFVKLDGLEKKQRTLVPKRKGRSSNIDPEFFYDNSKYLFEHGERQDATKAQTKRVAEVTQDEGALAVLSFLERDEWPQEIQDAIREEDPYFSFKIAGDSDLIFERPKLRSFWVASRQPTGEKKRCRVTGELAPIARLHPSISNISSKPAKLVAFNQQTAKFEGRDQGENFETSSAVADAYAAALNHLCEPTEDRWKRSAARLFRDTLAILFTVAERDLSPILSVLDPTPKKGVPIREITEPAWEKLVALPEDEEPCHILIVKGNMTRISLYDAFSIPLSELVCNLQQFRSELGGHSLYETLNWLDNGKETNLGVSIFEAVARGSPFPPVLSRSKVERWQAASLIRNHATDKEFTMSLKQDHPSVAYQIGRFVAIVNRLENDAYDRKAVPLTQNIRRVGGPISVFSKQNEIARKCLDRLRMLRTRGGKFVTDAEKLYEEVSPRIASSDPLPNVFSPAQLYEYQCGLILQQQAMFAAFKERDKKRAAESEARAKDLSEDGEDRAMTN